MNQIELTSSIFIAKGRDRACYHHPFQANLCVKVAVKPEKQSLREKAYLNFLTQKHTDLHAVSQYRGEVSTNLGKGYLFDLAMNYDGSLSKTLKQAIQEDAIPQQEVNKLLAQLKHYLESNLICVKDLSPSNLAYVKTNENKATLFIIDGIGNPTHNPLTIRFKPLTQKVINQTWTRLERKVKQLYHANLNYKKIKKIKPNRKLQLLAIISLIFLEAFSLFVID